MLCSRTRNRTLAGLGLALALLGAPGLAHASPEMDQAEVLYRAGERDVNSGDYPGAIDKWTQAYDLLQGERNSARTRNLRSIMAVNIATLQIGTYDRGIAPGDLKSAQKLLAGYLLQYEAALGKKAATDPDLARVRQQLVEVESRIANGGSMAGPSVEGGDPSFGGGEDPVIQDDPGPRRRRRGGGGKVFRSYPWERLDEPLFLMQFDWEGPAIQETADTVAVDPVSMVQARGDVDTQRKRGWGAQISFWTRPRTMWQLGYGRNLWEARDAAQPFETRLNDITAGLSVDLLALDRDWRVYPVLLPYARGGFAWGQRDSVNPDTFTSEEDAKFRGGVVQVGGHFGLLIRLEKVALMLRGGVGKPWYFLGGDGDKAGLESPYFDALRWEAGLGFGFSLD